MTARPLNDTSLTEAGLAPRGQGSILLIACGALAREILDLKAVNGWDHLDLACLPAKLHNTPDKITGAVRAAVAKHRAQYDRLFVVYADCGTGGQLQAACEAARDNTTWCPERKFRSRGGCVRGEACMVKLGAPVLGCIENDLKVSK